MMTPEIRDLICRAVDGQLTTTERKRVDLLLRESESAKTLYRQLLADAARLRSLSTVLPPVDIASRVLTEIRERHVSPTPTPPKPKSPTINWNQVTLWLNVATAAGVFLTVGIASYLYFSISHQQQEQQRSPVVAQAKSAKTPVDTTSQQTLPSKSATNQVTEEPLPETLVHAPTPKPVPPTIERGPQPRIIDDNILTAPTVDAMPEINAINITRHRVSRFVTLPDLVSTDATHTKLQQDIKKDLKADELIRLDLFCREPKVAMELFNNMLKAKGLQTITDRFLLDRLAKKPASEIVFFTDALHPDDVFQLMQQLAQIDQKASSRAGQLDTLVIAPFLPADLDMLGRILGVSSAISKQLPKQKSPIDIRKPLPEGTANQLAQNLNKISSQPSASKKANLVFVGSYAPINPTPAQSKEVKQYLEQRADIKPDCKPLMLVLRTVN